MGMISLYEACKKYKISYPSLYWRVRSGELEGHFVEGKIYVDEEKVKEVVEAVESVRKRRLRWKEMK